MLGLIFLKFADNKYRQHEDAILQAYNLKGNPRGRWGATIVAPGNVYKFNVDVGADR